MYLLYKRYNRFDTLKKKNQCKKNLSLDEVINKPYSKVTIELKENFNIMKLKKYCLLKERLK